jgi:hypothetical protein
MSDKELCKALKLLAFLHNDGAMTQAADRIEALLNLNEALVELMDDREANLAKLVSIAKQVTSFEDTTEKLLECGCAGCMAHLNLRATLAEIEGEKG